MEPREGSDRREFVRVRAEIPVKYKFLSRFRELDEMEEVYEGKTRNISEGGLLLEGPIPVLDWTSDLLMMKTVIGVNLFLPNSEIPVKALTRVAWLEHIEAGSNETRFGLTFKEITTEAKNKITQFVISSTLKK